MVVRRQRVKSHRMVAHPYSGSPCSGLGRQYVVQYCRTSCRYSALHNDCKRPLLTSSDMVGHSQGISIRCCLCSYYKTAALFLWLLFRFFPFVIPCTHVVNRERKTAALNVNVTGKVMKLGLLTLWPWSWTFTV